ncbi:MAG: deoxyribose-phosphate aldolase [Chloroflexota bacterium]|nr:deoxyribose-phosphate aldolase [Chloroflexota bacterium]
MIDHTLLKPDATADKIAQLCFEAQKYHFASVCVNPTNVKLCADLLRDTDVKVCTVIGFPLGATPTEVKAFETKNALQNGATEIDMVINIGALKAGDNELVARDIREVVRIAHEAGALVKVIIETALLTDEEKVIACLLAKEAGADFVKTSTGFSSGGATVHDVALMRKSVGPNLGVKAAGGIHTFEEAEQMIAAGATRIGASAGIKIIKGDEPDNTPVKPSKSSKSY